MVERPRFTPQLCTDSGSGIFGLEQAVLGSYRARVVLPAFVDRCAAVAGYTHDDLQHFWAYRKKPTVGYRDAAIYGTYQTEGAKIRSAGGKTRRVVVDYEIKKGIYRLSGSLRLRPR